MDTPNEHVAELAGVSRRYGNLIAPASLEVRRAGMAEALAGLAREGRTGKGVA